MTRVGSAKIMITVWLLLIVFVLILAVDILRTERYVTMPAFLSFDWMLFGYWVGAHLLALALFTALYLRLTPYDDIALVKEGKAAPAIALGGALLGFMTVVMAVNKSTQTLIEFACWTGISMLVQLVVCLIFRSWLVQAVKDNNTALATLYAVLTYVVGQALAHSM